MMMTASLVVVRPFIPVVMVASADLNMIVVTVVAAANIVVMVMARSMIIVLGGGRGRCQNGRGGRQGDQVSFHGREVPKLIASG